MTLNSVPTLNEIAAHPERASDVPPAAAAALLVQLAGVQTALLTRLLAPADNGQAAPVEDRLLKAKEAAAQLGYSTDWLYRHADRLPFVVRNGRQLRFSAHGIDRYIRERRGISY